MTGEGEAERAAGRPPCCISTHTAQDGCGGQTHWGRFPHAKKLSASRPTLHGSGKPQPPRNQTICHRRFKCPCRTTVYPPKYILPTQAGSSALLDCLPWTNKTFGWSKLLQNKMRYQQMKTFQLTDENETSWDVNDVLKKVKQCQPLRVSRYK